MNNLAEACIREFDTVKHTFVCESNGRRFEFRILVYSQVIRTHV